MSIGIDLRAQLGKDVRHNLYFIEHYKLVAVAREIQVCARQLRTIGFTFEIEEQGVKMLGCDLTREPCLTQPRLNGRRASSEKTFSSSLRARCSLSSVPHWRGLPWRSVAVELQQQMDSDPEIEVAPLSEALFQAAFELLRVREDKGWSLTDCVSFTLMRERAITAALSTDAHFSQAGFDSVLLG